ncbi:MAG: hypothetical protein CXR30_09570 [Geobacter sp.]|nr:MAG: hypothetical protein CXR30_09570 [Geobacter sp.]
MAQHEMKPGTSIRRRMLVALLLLVLLPTASAFCEEDNPEDFEPEIEVPDTTVVDIKPYSFAEVQSGYLFVTPDGPTAAASTYGRLKSGVTGGFSAARLDKDLKLLMNGTYLNEDDYLSELYLDYAGLVRLHVESGALWHNLLSDPLPPGTATYSSRDLSPGANLGLRTLITNTETRIKLGNNPFHLNLGYWQLARSGYEQLHFSDHYNGGSNATNTVYSQASRVDRITREGKVGFDGHLGWFDLTYDFLVRDFANNAADNRFPFANSGNGALITGAQQAHDTIPNSRLTSHTVKIYSDMSGGLVGTAAYTLTQRENNGGHGDAVPSSTPSDTIHSAAGDISYTPFKELSLAIKYRHLEVNRDTPTSVYYPYSQIPATGTIPGVYTADQGTLLVRQATDTARDILVFSSIFRPSPKVIYRLEYRAELESRDNIHDQQSPGSPDALHSDSRQTHTGKASFYWKPIKNLKLDAFYSYAACDNPAYGASFSGQHIGKLLLTFTDGGKWGLTGSYLAKYETADSTAMTVAPAPVASWNVPRESRSNSANASAWFSPLERLTISASYSFLETVTDQSLLFSSLISDPSPISATNYYSAAHVYGIDMAYAVSEPLDVSLAFQQVRSKSRFNVASQTFNLAGVTGTFNTNDISGLNVLDSTETGVSARADWRITQMLACALDYSFRLYDSGNPAYDGSVHTTMLSLKAKW